MKKTIAIFIIIIVFVATGMAGIPDRVATSIENTQSITNRSDDSKVILKTKFMGLDKEDKNSYSVGVNITTNKLGHLIYKEDYYLDSNGNRTLYSSKIFYDDILRDFNISFKILRPRNKNKEKYNVTLGTVILNNEILINTTMSSSGTYKSNLNNVNYSDYSDIIEQRLVYESGKKNTIRSSDILYRSNTTSMIQKPIMRTSGFEVFDILIVIYLIIIYKNTSLLK